MKPTPRMLLVYALAGAVVVGVIALAAFGTWWVLAGALVAHAIGTTLVLGITGRAVAQQDKPDPVTEAAIAEGAIESRNGTADEAGEFGIPERGR